MLACLALGAAGNAVRGDKSAEPPEKRETVRGRVVWLAEAMKRLHGVATDDDAAHAVIALETAEKRLIPLLKDARGRGFHLDPRLLKFDYELELKRFPGVPMAQVIRVCTLKNGKRYELDYWCDICAIPMYELKECECCQGPIRLRERLVEEAGREQ